MDIHNSRHMKVGVSVHTTSHFYDSHRRPFLSNTGKGVVAHGDGGLDPDRSGLTAQRAHHRPTGGRQKATIISPSRYVWVIGPFSALTDARYGPSVVLGFSTPNWLGSGEACSEG